MIEAHVARRAAEWFPSSPRAKTIRVRKLESRPRALLYAVTVDPGSNAPQILVKVRLDGAGSSGVNQVGGRPRLATQDMGLPELSAAEYEGLRSIQGVFGQSHPAFGVVRPLDHLQSENLIMMEYVQAGTLRQDLLRRNRLPPRSRSARESTSSQAWWRAGAWLRTFHESIPVGDRPTRQGAREDVIALFHAYDRYLNTRLGSGGPGDLTKRGARLAEQVLPHRLPLAVGHGDYAPRNVFLGLDGRLTVFDPLPRWLVPRYEDLSRFLVSIRLLGLQVHTHGASFRATELERLESEVIRGYYGSDVPRAELRCYELLIMLDKWSALVDSSHRGGRARVRMASVRLASHYLRGQAERLIDLAGPDRD